MEHVAELIRSRRSVRTFDATDISAEDMKKLTEFISCTENPYNIPVGFKILDGNNKDLKCPVVSGAKTYITAKAASVPHMEEAVGYSFEMLMLSAQSIGIGSVWIGGTMDRKAFERAAALADNEKMPCMAPFGYPAKKMSVKESLMRKAVKADARNPFEALFFDGEFENPLTKEKAGTLAAPLEAVRLAPSAVNKQPWRVVVNENKVHFYLKRTKGFISEAVGDMQKIDMGIALCHFALAAKEDGLNIRFDVTDPGIAYGDDIEYIASYIIL